MAFYTPLRYPGGKGKLSYYVKSIIEHNNLLDGTYIEPYAGGASVAIELLLEEYVRNIIINDIDPAIYSFWSSVLENTDELCKRISDVNVTMDSWYEQKEIISSPEKYSKVDIGFATFFLNRTNRSGILKAGVIGGKEQKGKWTLDVRFNKSDLIERISKISKYKSRIKVFNKDTLELIESEPAFRADNTLIYLDPPYYVKGQGLYRNYYVHDDHLKIKNALSAANIKYWIVSYDNASEIKELYSEFRQDEYSLQYTAQNKKNGQEVMIFSEGIDIPPLRLGK
ncbi:DNA adenine methylase [Aeromonas hydrophila]|uniref:DNA adenine methylase n=1 Tax=Aeromonas hydrophila TaxID=644 RepID=UPI001A925563|nr:DNA adenine methylase [Aeromonas hydrophila]MBO0409007.1 DNA adenine methylase [Aeromonas hydrophila]